MYIALCLVVNIKCIVCVVFFFFSFFFKGGGLKLIANQTGNGEAGFYVCLFCPLSCCLFSTRRNLREKKKLKGTEVD